MTPGSNYILGIESAVAGGSLSLYCGGAEIRRVSGNGIVARAEELLPSIDRLLRDSDLSIRDLSTIIVSIGPGSYTGIRVGLATVLGFRSSLQIKCVGLTSLQAIALSVGEESSVVAAVPMGRNMICSQVFEHNRPSCDPRLSTMDGLTESMSRFDGAIVLHKTLFDEANNAGCSQLIDAGTNIASHLVAAADSEFVSEDLAPLFVDRP